VPAILTALLASGWVWSTVAARWRSGMAVLPYTPRRPVPWRGGHVLAVMLAYVLTLPAAVSIVRLLLGPEVARELANVEPAGTDHPIARLAKDGSGWMLPVAFLAAVVVAPLVEEFLFRLLLQGWLEAAWGRCRRKLPALRRLGPRAVVPVTLVALLFAWMHYRTAGPQYRAQYLAAIFIGQAVAGLVTVAFALGLLRWHAGANAADLGWQWESLPGDARLGLLAFLALAAPTYLLQVCLSNWLPVRLAPDPVPLFFFALGLGTLYYRTHRITPSLVLHAALNFISLTMLWAGMQ
jgi:membrane protease YdiL (CAAX protease family)